MNVSNRYEIESLARHRQATIERDLRAAALLREGREPMDRAVVPAGKRIWGWLAASILFLIGVVTGILLSPIVR